MFTFIDENYRKSIYALKLHHSRKNMILAGLFVFLIFTIVIILMFINRGWLMILSVPISFAITFIYLYFMNKDMRKKLLQSKVSIKKLTVKINDESIYTEALFNDKNLVSTEINLQKIVKVVETKAFYFLYENSASAIVLNKNGLVGTNNKVFHEFLTSKFVVKKYAK